MRSIMNQINQLTNWGFKKQGNDYKLNEVDIEVKFNVNFNSGAFTIDGELNLIHGWEELESLMEQIL